MIRPLHGAIASCVLLTACASRGSLKSKWTEPGPAAQDAVATETETPQKAPPIAFIQRAASFSTGKPEDLEAGLQWLDAVALKMYPDDPRLLECKALFLFQKGGSSRQQGVLLAQQVVAVDETRYLAQRVLGDHHFASVPQGAAECIEAYLAYFRHRPIDDAAEDGMIHVKLGLAYLHVSNLVDAELHFSAALAHHATDDRVAKNARSGLCATYAGTRKYELAIAMCEEALASQTTGTAQPSIYYNVGKCYAAVGRLDDALRAAEAYVAANPSEGKGYLFRGDLHYRLGHWEAALADYEAAVTYVSPPRWVAGRTDELRNLIQLRRFRMR